MVSRGMRARGYSREVAQPAAAAQCSACIVRHRASHHAGRISAGRVLTHGPIPFW